MLTKDDNWMEDSDVLSIFATFVWTIPSDRFSHVTARIKENDLNQLTEESIHEIVIQAAIGS